MRDLLIKKKMQEIGAASFPDDEVTWNVIGTTHRGHYSAIEAVPYPSTVGYDKFKFIVGFADEKNFHVVGCYCWHEEKWSLLFTDPDARDDWKKLFS